jgi:hypothetical protein
MKVVQIEVIRAQASAFRAMLDNCITMIQYLESGQPQNLPEHFEEKDTVITALTAVENELQEALAVIDGMGELSRRGQGSTKASPLSQ